MGAGRKGVRVGLNAVLGLENGCWWAKAGARGSETGAGGL